MKTSSYVPILLVSTTTVALADIIFNSQDSYTSDKLHFPQVSRQRQLRQVTEAQKNDSIKRLDEKINILEADQNGLYLLGLFDLHQSDPRFPFKCGQIDTNAGESTPKRAMQNMQAFLWAIQQINMDKSLLPGIKLGSLVLDTCSSFLGTNQKLANILHEGHTQRKLPSPRQMMGIVADTADWHSVEAAATMASALGLTTYVTQTRSTKFTGLAKKYLPKNLSDLISDLEESRSTSAKNSKQLQHQFEGLLSELLGVGRMTTPFSLSDYSKDLNSADGQELGRNESSSQIGAKLFLVKMLLGNELLAEAIAALIQQMNWDFVSIIYDDDLEMIDLHDELARQLFARNTQFGLDEQIISSSSEEVYEKLLRNLTKKSAIGSRVVISLMSTGNTKNLLKTIRRLRSSLVTTSSNRTISSQQREFIKSINSLLWVTVTDREPYYSFATEALGAIAISSSSSLIPEFKTYYDKLTNDVTSTGNKWWPEYIKSILVNSRKTIELVSNECSKWEEPSSSLLNDKCRSLSLTSLVQHEKKALLNEQQDAKMILSRNNKPSADAQKQAMFTQGDSHNKTEPKVTYQGLKMSKYLASGWEHNGMEVINSVLAIANGLESIRQTLCPDLQSGICDRMRELIYPSAILLETDEKNELPTLSELIYNELLRSTFQLADGRMFNLDESLGGQVESRLRLYNLRYLQHNSIGFVKFGQYDQQEGLSLNITKAKYYPSNSYADQRPLNELNSTCQDETKCLTFKSSFMNEADNLGKPISEEELAAGMNNLFKLDHTPSGSKQSLDVHLDHRLPVELGTNPKGPLSKQEKLSNNELNGQEQQYHSIGQSREDSHVRTMTSPPKPSILGHFTETSSENTMTEAGDSPRVSQTRSKQTFDTIVLLPLHKGYQSSRSSSLVGSSGANSFTCSSELDVEHSFQHLTALAYAQTLVNGQNLYQMDARKDLPALEPSNQQQHSSDSNGQQIEFTTTVIDYCGSVEFAAESLASKLNESASKSMAVIDFESDVSGHIDRFTSERNLLHLTIALPSAAGAPNEAGLSRSRADNGEDKKHLHFSLLPSKVNEIEALVKILSSSSNNWKLVHLIYTDDHHHRDEFVRRANEAGICVSKLIWIPGSSSTSASSSIVQQQQLDELSQQVEKTRELLANELYDYHESSQVRNNSGRRNGYLDEAAIVSQGLNATRILVVLASSNELTNKIIHSAASESMLNDYIWVTTHEWLSSVEIPAERLSRVMINKKLPRYFLSTRLETYESHSFKRFYSKLSPAIHSPIPTDWFDEFWQQNFQCRLPISRKSQNEPRNTPKLPLCQSNQHLDTHQLIEDDRVHYIIRAIESLHSAAKVIIDKTSSGGSNESLAGGRMLELANQFLAKFNHHSELSPAALKSGHRHAKTPFGFQIVHRILPPSTDELKKRRRANSRDLSADSTYGELETIGLWRNGDLIRFVHKESSRRILSASSATEDPIESGVDQERQLNVRLSDSMDQLTAIRSQCESRRTCDLCGQQIQQTIMLIRQEESRLKQSESAAEPKAISSFMQHIVAATAGGSANDSILDLIPESNFEDQEYQKIDGKETNRTATNRSDDPIQAAASSLFDSSFSKQIEKQRESDVRRAYNHMIQMESHKSYHIQPTFNLRLSPTSSPNISRQNGISENFVLILSLGGISVVIAMMTYYYPKIITGERIRRADSFSSIGTLVGYGDVLGRKSPDTTVASTFDTDKLNDYFLLTGLFMLFLTNISMPLPATKIVCSFRRVSLAASYTVILGSIFVKVLAARRRVTRRISSSIFTPRGSPSPDSELNNNGRKSTSGSRMPIDSLEECVEVTFESLPQDHQANSLSEEDPQVYLSNGYQTNTSRSMVKSSNETSFLGNQQGHKESDRPKAKNGHYKHHSSRADSNPTILVLVLLTTQLVCSWIWLVKIPPEPTLYMFCWYCSSPARAPIMFLYEQMISLLYPLVLLIVTWFCAISSYRSVIAKEEEFRLAVEKLQYPTNTVDNFEYRNHSDANLKNNLKQRLFSCSLRDTKSIILATTSLVLIWSVSTLQMISTKQKFLSSVMTTGPSNEKQQINPQSVDLSLAYANIISGYVIFGLLFIYKYRIFGYSSMANIFSCCLSCGLSRRHNKSDSYHEPNGSRSEAPGYRNQVLKYNQSKRTTKRSVSPNDLEEISAGNSTDLKLFSRSEINNTGRGWKSRKNLANEERVKLQQMNGPKTSYSTLEAEGIRHIGNGMSVSSKDNISTASGATKRSFLSNSFKGNSSKTKPAADMSPTSVKDLNRTPHKLQRRQSGASTASSTTKLVSSNKLMIVDQNEQDYTGDFFNLDNISCASSQSSG